MVELADYTLVGADGPVRLAEIFGDHPQLIVYNTCGPTDMTGSARGCTGFTSQFTRLDVLERYYDARFVIVTTGPSTKPSPTATGWATA